MKKIDKIPKWPYADEKEEKLISKVLESSNWWRNAGTQVKLFEKEFSSYQDCKGGITVTNGTVALEIALKSIGIEEGDEVIIPAFTFFSTVSAVLAVKAVPVIVDVLSDTFCIDPEEIKKTVTEKTKAIIPVHIAGHVSNMDAICEIAEKHNLSVIEDSAHAHGSVWKGKKAGSFGTMSTFSFQNAKLMTSGEGGILLSNDDGLIQRALLEANCGRAEGDTNYQHVLIGSNARMSELQGAVLRAQLSRLDEQVKLREKNYRLLSEYFKDIPGITLQAVDEKMTIHPHYMIMFYYDKHAFNETPREKFVEYLKQAGIPSNRSYETIYKLPVFSRIDKKNWRISSDSIKEGNICCSNSERISDEVVCLNHNILLGDEELIKSIVEVIKSFRQM